MKLLQPLLLILAAFFLALGLVLPIIRFDRLYFFSETPSLTELVAALWRGGDVGLAIIVGLFSIVFPIVKLAALAVQMLFGSAEADGAGKGTVFRRAMPYLSKWSMMDVMLVAIVVFAAKSSGLATAVSQPGLWFYAGSALIAGLMPALPQGKTTRR